MGRVCEGAVGDASRESSGAANVDSLIDVEVLKDARRRFLIAFARKNVQNIPVLCNKKDNQKNLIKLPNTNVLIPDQDSLGLRHQKL